MSNPTVVLRLGWGFDNTQFVEILVGLKLAKIVQFERITRLIGISSFPILCILIVISGLIRMLTDVYQYYNVRVQCLYLVQGRNKKIFPAERLVCGPQAGGSGVLPHLGHSPGLAQDRLGHH